MIKILHPFVLFMFFFYVIFTAVFTFNPLFLLPALFGALLFLIKLDGAKTVKILIAYIIIFVFIALSNPLFSHNGATVLFFINDSRITFESLIYGICAAMMIVSMLVWFNCFNKVFDSEKIMYLLGRIFPKLALVFSMTLNFIPRMIKDFRSINNAQKSVKQSRVKRYIGSFSAVITRCMENSIITSDSMNARGYMLKGRTFFHRYRFTVTDAVYLCVFTALFVTSLLWKCEVIFYPVIQMNLTALNCVSVISYFFLAILPFVIEVKEALKWKLSLPKI
ncbi:MAG: energy-coupling factor transporter transmembrane protein EcfT [Ruminococcus sp.]|nr:energy-coupling factor transporter transmembrane protein EcfT [Ruminococcus sp.]